MSNTRRRSDAPPSYASLTLRNFRGFSKTTEIPFEPLTFLVRPNSGGKSSVCNAMLLISQSGLTAPIERSFRPVWSGDLVDLGSFRDAVFKHETSRKISIGFSLANVPGDYAGREIPPVSLNYVLEASTNDLIGFVTKISIREETSGQTLTLSRPKRVDAGISIQIFSAERISKVVQVETEAGALWNLFEQ